MEGKILYETLGESPRWIKNLLFAGVFIQENRLHAVYDRYNEMSCKQWLLMAVYNAFPEPPDLSSLAEAMGCSRQNVKKLALNLERDGYVTLEKSPADGRSLIVKKTEKGLQFSKNNTELGEGVHAAIFREFTEEEIAEYYRLSIKLMHGIDFLEEFFKAREREKQVRQNTDDVDAVSGATISSQTIRNAVNRALQQGLEN